MAGFRSTSLRRGQTSETALTYIHLVIQIHQPQERLDKTILFLYPILTIQIHQPQERLDRRNQWLRIVYPHLDPLASGEARLDEIIEKLPYSNLDPLASGEARHNVALQMWQEPKFRSTSLRRGQTGINTKRLLITGIQIHQPQERLDTVLDSEQPMPYIFRSTSLRRGQTAITTIHCDDVIIQIHQPQERLDWQLLLPKGQQRLFRSTSLRRGQTYRTKLTHLLAS